MRARAANFLGSSLAILLGIVLVVAASVFVLGLPRCHGGHRRPPAVNNMRNLVLLLAEQANSERAWPEYSGPAFVLTLVRKGYVDPRRRENLCVLWPDNEIPEGLDLTRYGALTPEVLRTGDLRGLTAAAGRRNLDPKYRLVASDVSEPIVGWRVGDGVVLGFTDGWARFLGREQLGLDDDDPIVFGEASKSDLLRPLSED